MDGAKVGSATVLPNGTWAFTTAPLADGSIESPFLEMFGRPPRNTSFESERTAAPSVFQAQHLLNSSHIQRKIEQSAKLRALLQQNKGKPLAAVEALYLTILSRYPTDDELKIATKYGGEPDAPNQRFGIDLAWALINSAEFQYRH